MTVAALVVSIVAAVISSLALLVSRAAYRLNARRDREETDRRNTEQFERARLVMLIYGFMGAPAIDVENRTEDTITDVDLERIECPDLDDEWHIEPNRAVPGTVSEWPSIPAGATRTFPFILINPEGERDDMVAFGQDLDFEVTLAYTDAQGQRWRRVNSGDPQRIER